MLKTIRFYYVSSTITSMIVTSILHIFSTCSPLHSCIYFSFQTYPFPQTLNCKNTSTITCFILDNFIMNKCMNFSPHVDLIESASFPSIPRPQSQSCDFTIWFLSNPSCHQSFWYKNTSCPFQTLSIREFVQTLFPKTTLSNYTPVHLGLYPNQLCPLQTLSKRNF